ncbi:hypothetical protein RRG08_053072 [Elysia crispata]|uniref:Uncharacterized protein n=1 Tax=Elysia crispata TaxID=231223 RepID=A0AAE0XTW5_9GAST|nr:hypothetical protein RRG08_053072 [Elysia crispata]
MLTTSSEEHLSPSFSQFSAISASVCTRTHTHIKRSHSQTQKSPAATSCTGYHLTHHIWSENASITFISSVSNPPFNVRRTV